MVPSPALRIRGRAVREHVHHLWARHGPNSDAAREVERAAEELADARRVAAGSRDMRAAQGAVG